MKIGGKRKKIGKIRQCYVHICSLSDKPYKGQYLNTHNVMEYPPTDWPCFNHEDFELAVPRDPGDLGLEVMAQARPTGRVLDHIRTVLAGSQPITVTFSTRDIFLAPDIPAARLKLELWPRDVLIRRNMASSEWADVLTILTSNELLIDPVPGPSAAANAALATNEALVAYLNAAADKKTHSAAIRWAIGAGADNMMELVLQALPASANQLSGKPAFKG